MATSTWFVPEVIDVESGMEKARSCVRGYLQQFGYLDRTRAAYQLDFDVDDRAALRSMQHFLGLPATGTYNQETVTAMAKKRCGFPDMNGIADFKLQGNKWPPRPLTWKLVNESPDLPRTEIARALEAALSEWSQYLDIYDGRHGNESEKRKTEKRNKQRSVEGGKVGRGGARWPAYANPQEAPSVYIFGYNLENYFGR